MSAAWRAFIGLWDDPEYAAVDEIHPTWSAARDRVADILRRFTVDDCSYCRYQGTAESARLDALASGEEFAGEVEGDDYCIVRTDREDIDDLHPS